MKEHLIGMKEYLIGIVNKKSSTVYQGLLLLSSQHKITSDFLDLIILKIATCDKALECDLLSQLWFM